MKKLITFLILSFLFIDVVHANCSYSEELNLNSKAANVQYSYELKTDATEYEDGVSNEEYFVITIMNITEGIYVTVNDNVSNQTRTYRASDTNNGTVTFNWNDIEHVTNFKLTVYSDTSTGCPNENLKVARFTTPRYNDYYNRAICNDLEDFYLCQKYTTVEEIDDKMFFDRVDSYMNGTIDKQGEDTEEKKGENKIINFLNKNKWYFIGGTVVVVGVGAAILIIRKKRGELVK